MSLKAQSTFTLLEANEVIYSEVEEGSKLTRGYFEVEYKGDLQGKGDLQELKCYLPDGSATVYGFERIIGRIGDKSGSFVLEHVGNYKNGLLISKRTVVQGSGTGGLTGIVGKIYFESGSAEEFQITFNYEYK